jgi:hypothetical protein
MVFIFSFAACTNPKTAPETTIAKTTIKITPQIEEYLNNFKNIKSKFIEKYELAKVTSKIALPPIVSQMQDVKNELKDLKVPNNDEQLVYLNGILENTMESAITVFMVFQGENRTDKYHMEFVENCFAGVDKIIENMENPKSSSSNPETIKLRYVVTGPAGYTMNEVLFSDQNGKLNKINNLKMSKDFTIINKDLNNKETVKDNEKYKGEIIAEFNDFPKDGFIYLETNNNFDEEAPLGLFVYINGKLNSFAGSTLESEKKFAITKSTTFDNLD